MIRLQDTVKTLFDKELSSASNEEIFVALLKVVKDEIKENGYNQGKKKVYYISAEFLLGKLLSNNLINLGIYDQIKTELEENNKSLAEIEEIETEPSLGNGGLGRLAACFIDSIATLGLNGAGVSINYHFGLFKQVFHNMLQQETPDSWLSDAIWTDKVVGKSYKIPYKDFTLDSTMYTLDICGYNSKSVKLHLFDIDTIDESIVENGIRFNQKDIAKNLTLFIYPDDSTTEGLLLRIYQQYFMASNGAQLAMEEAKERGCIDLHNLHEYVAIQINDTHPSLVIPELIRLLTNEGLSFDESVEEVLQICAYTNHTILAEALETWPIDFLKEVVPHLVPIICQLDKKAKEAYTDPSVAIIDESNLVHMAHMDIHYTHSTNGVAKLHTEILKNTELNNFYNIYPERFNNKTNGITFRRWLISCNPELTKFIIELIGNGFMKDATELEKLLQFKNDKTVLNKLYEIKKNRKVALKEFIKNNTGEVIDENSIMDIQAKRLHLYKRQQLNILYIIHKYIEIKEGNIPTHPITFIFGAKAAPAYNIAKDVIHVILCLQKLINNDPIISKYMKVIMVENYNVTAGEKMFPACDISEQISLASKEASGTGNMKFMLNGAVTLGTMDGANVEIAELVGMDNIYTFGQSSQEIIEHYQKNDYHPLNYFINKPQISKLVSFLLGPEMLSVGHYNHLVNFHNELVMIDSFMTLLDLEDYICVKDQLLKDYANRESWAQKMLVNIAKAGYFSSDRSIEEYNNDIWHL